MKSAVFKRRGFTLIELLVVITLLAILAGLLFPVFAEVRGKARQAACLSNLRQIGTALALYLQDYDGHMPSCCSFGRGPSRVGVGDGWHRTSTWRLCAQVGITMATPTDTYLGPDQTPPRYLQELLHPYARNAHLWFCPSVGKDRLWVHPSVKITYGFQGTTYNWNHGVSPSRAGSSHPFSTRPRFNLSGRSVALIPRPTEAPVLWDEPALNALKEPCTSMDLKPAHAKGLNVLYADTHVKFSPFTGRPTQYPDALTPSCVEDWWADHHWEGFFE